MKRLRINPKRLLFVGALAFAALPFAPQASRASEPAPVLYWFRWNADGTAGGRCYNTKCMSGDACCQLTGGTEE